MYGDVLFIINFSMDFLSLFICAKILHKKIRTLPLVLAASLGGVYAVTSLFFDVPGAFTIFFDACTAYVICLAAFEIEKGKIISFSAALIPSFVFFVTEMLLGGVMTALINLLGRTSIGKGALYAENETPLWIFALVAPVSSILTYFGGRIFGRRAEESTAKVTIDNEGNTLCLCALVDSANLLQEPVSGRPVVIVGYEKIKNFLPGEIRSFVERGGTELASLSFQRAVRIKLIPAASVGGKSVLVGFVPDRMEICVGGRKKSADAVVAIEKNTENFGGTDAIIPACLVNT